METTIMVGFFHRRPPVVLVNGFVQVFPRARIAPGYVRIVNSTYGFVFLQGLRGLSGHLV